MPVAFSPNHDDNHGGASWRTTAGFGHRHGIGVATSARHHHRGRTHCEPDADAVHHSRGVYLHRPPATVAGKPFHQSSRAGSAASRILIVWWPDRLVARLSPAQMARVVAGL